MSWFSSRLFKESARTTRIMNILYIIVAIAAGCYVPVFMYYIRSNHYDGGNLLLRPQIMTDILFWVVLIFNIMEIMKLFSFHFSRKGSDFYHALPFTRQCFYFTNVSLVLIRDAIAIALSLGIQAILYKVLDVAVYDISFVFWGFAEMMVVSMMVITALMIAISLSGTALFAGVFGMLILVFPRFLYMATLHFISDMSRVLPSYFVPYFSTKYNIFFNCILRSFNGSINVYEGYNIPGFIVSLILALAMGCIGMMLFVNRKSEYAESAVPGHATDVLVHLMVTLAAALPMTGLFLLSDNEFAVTLGVASVIFFAVYAAYRRKGVKGFVKTLPRLLTVGVICLIYAGVISGVSYSATRKEIKAENVKGVQIYYGGEGETWVDDLSSHLDYDEVAHHDVVYTDDEVIGLCVKGYNRLTDAESSYERAGAEYTVRFIMNDGSEVIRNILLTSNNGYMSESSVKDEVTILNELVVKDKARIEFACSIPEDGLYADIFESKERNRRIVEIFEEEFSKLPEEKKLKVTDNTSYEGDDFEVSGYESEITVNFETYYNKTVPTYYRVLVTKKLLPETYKYYTESIIAEKQETVNRIHDMATGGEEGSMWADFVIVKDGVSYNYTLSYNKHDIYSDASMYVFARRISPASDGDASYEDEYEESIVMDKTYSITGDKASEGAKLFVEAYSVSKANESFDTVFNGSYYSVRDYRDSEINGVPVNIDSSALEKAEKYFMENADEEY